MHSFCIAQNNTIKLQIKGIDSAETSVIDSVGYTENFRNFNELNTEANNLRTKLLKSGYLDIKTPELKKVSDSLFTCLLELNKKYKTLTIHYDDQSIPKEVLTRISSEVDDYQFSIPFEKSEETLQFIANYFVNQGKTFSNLYLTKIKKTKNGVSAKLESLKSTTRIIDDIIIKGYTKFPYSFLRYNTRIKKGSIFNKNNIVEKSRNIDNLGFAKNIKPPEVLFRKDSTSVYLYLEKRPANTFDGFLGFSSDTESGNLELNGYVNLNLTNNLNYGEQLSLIYKSDGNDQQRFQANITLPYILKTPLGIEAGLDIFKKDSTFLITEQKINVNYLIDDKNSLFLGYKTASSDNLLDLPQPNLNIVDYSSSFFAAGFKHVKQQNNNLFPIKNKYAISTEFGSRKTTLKTTNQVKGILDFHYRLKLNQRNFIFLRNQGAILLSENVFTNELFRFGGINSIRGFEENSLNASLFNVTNTEYQYLLSSNLYIHSIIDYSYFEDETLQISDNLTSFGFGLGLNTKTGLFRIIFANGKNSNSSFKFSNTKVHISLNATF